MDGSMLCAGSLPLSFLVCSVSVVCIASLIEIDRRGRLPACPTRRVQAPPL